MFTTKKKNSSDWSLGPQSSGGELVLDLRNGDRSAEKGKAVASPAYNNRISPHLSSLRRNFDGGGGREAADWRGFKEAGLLDQSFLEKQDGEALVRKISKLENELYDYQYNMGLLLIEKQECLSTYKELSQALTEAREILKREQTARLMALSEVEERDENLRQALENEKQCVADYKKALHVTCWESDAMKLTYGKKMAEADTRVSRIEENSLAVEAKLHAADAKFAEVSRKSLEMEKKLKGTETYEYLLQTERRSLNAEKEMSEVTLSKQREELQEWENSLREREERQLEGRRTLNQREERSNENYSRVEQKENDLKEAQRKNESISITLKDNEDAMNIRLAELAKKEEEVNAVQKTLGRKEKELLALEEKLIATEGVEIQKLCDDHNAILDLRKHNFELEMVQKRKAIDEELINRVVVVELKEAQVFQMEETIGKREKALEKKLDEYEEKKGDLELNREALREREKSPEAEEKNLEMVNKNMLTDKENLRLFEDELDKKQLQLHTELETLKGTEEERSELQCVQSELRQVKDECARQDELLSKEREALKWDTENYEKEWEVLDEKKAEITHLLNQVNEEKEKFEKLKSSNEERLKNESLIAQDYIRKKLEDLEFKKGSFEASMEQERLLLSEKAQTERNHMIHDLELQKRELELDMQSKLEKMQNNFLEKEREMKVREHELNNINHSREVASRAMKEMIQERLMIENEIQEMGTSKQHLEGQRLELRKDIDKLNILVKKLKDQSKKMQEFLEKHENCKNCGEAINDFALSDIQILQEMGSTEVSPLPRLSEGYTSGSMKGNIVGSERMIEESSSTGAGRVTSGGRFSSLLQCTSKIHDTSPLNRSEGSVAQGHMKESPRSDVQLNFEALQGLSKNVIVPSSRIQSAENIRDDEGHPSVDEHSNMDFKALEVPEVSMYSELKIVHDKPGINPRCGVRRTGSVKAVIEEAKVILGKTPEPIEGNQPSGITNDKAGISGDSRGDSLRLDDGASAAGRKQHSYSSETTASVQDLDSSEAHSVSVTERGSRKRRQNVNRGSQTPVKKHYNLRQRKT